MDSNGTFYFSCFNSSVKVTLTISNSNYIGFYKWPIAFSDDATQIVKTTVPSNGHHHQFRHGFTFNGKTTVIFIYNNDNDGGKHDHVPRHPSSQYGLYFADTRTDQYLGAVDPTINNGGND